MTDNLLTLNGEILRESFCEWQSEQEALDAEWSESLAALTAYQSHLDAWQQELVEERESLRREREAWERNEEATKLVRDQSASQANAQLAEAREKISLLSEQLLSRTEELRVLDQRRAELTIDLELARVHAKELAADVDEQKQTFERERSAWTEQLRQMHELLELRAATPVTGYDDVIAAAAERPAPPAPRPPKAIASVSGEKPSPNNPVLGSIMEQFGKLRQQRANDRQTGKNAR